MTDLKKAAQQALEALEGLFGSPEKWESGGVAVWKLGGSDAPRQAITALRTALAMHQVSDFAQAQEQAEPPPEWESINNILDEYGLDAIAFVKAWKAVQQRAEPVAWMDREGDLYKMPEIKNWAPPHVLLYTTPPQRQWVGLTDDDFCDQDGEWADGASWAEAKLKERNSENSNQ